MSEKEFWYGDPKLYQAYQKQYFERLSYESYIQGLYNYIGVSTALSNFARKKGEKAQSYLDKPINLYGEPKKTKQQAYLEYEKGRQYQMEWVNSLSTN